MHRQLNTRNKIKLVLSMMPGIYLRGLERALGISFNSTRYHVDKLLRDGEAIRLDDKRYSRLYPPRIDSRDIILATAMRNKTDRKVLYTLLRMENLSSEQLREITHLAKSTLSEHLTRLVELGLVKKTPASGGLALYSLSNLSHVKSLIERSNLPVLEKAIDRFAALWDF